MSTLTIRALPSGKYNARVYSHTDADGKKHTKSITAGSKAEVKRLAAAFIAERDALRAQRLTINISPTLGEATDKYIASKSNVLSPSTLREYRRIRNKNVQSLMAISVSEITPELIQQAINAEAVSRSPKTIRNIHALISAVLAVARPDIRLSTTLPVKVKPDIKIPTEQEMKQIFIDAAGTDIELPVYLAACCGLRRSEICALCWDDYDAGKQTITVRSARVLASDGEYKIKGTKTTASKRTIRILPHVTDILNDTPRESDYIVNIDPNKLTERFFALLKHSGIRHYRFHDLRHYAVSVMLSLNIPKAYIADYMGHETENMIDQVYGHIMAQAKSSFEDVLIKYYNSVIPSYITQNITHADNSV